MFRVIFTESSPNLGGQELQLLQQMQALEASGWGTILLARPNSRVFELAKEKGLNAASASFRNALDAGSILTLRDLIKKFKPAAIIAHSNHDANISALTLKTLANSPKLIRMRTYLAGQGRAYAYNKLFDITYTPSAFLRNQLLQNKEIKPEKIQVMYPGIDFQKLDRDVKIPQELSQWLALSKGPIIAHGSMLRAEKGQRLILEAIARLGDAFSEVRYIMAGEGYDKASIEKLAEELNLKERIFFTGLLTPITPLLRICDIAVMPSLLEPLGMFQTEALSQSIPVIASDVGGIPETVHHQKTGLLVPSGDINAWQNALTFALNNLDTMRIWAAEGSRQVRSQFAVERNTEQLISAILAPKATQP